MTGRPGRINTQNTVLCAILLCLAIFLPFLVHAQQTDLSQQMQMFQGLPADQQQVILQRLSGQGGGLGGFGSGSGLGGIGGIGGLIGGGQFNQSQQALLLQQQILQQRRQQQGLNLQEGAVPVFKPSDTALIEIYLPDEVPPGFNEQNPQGLVQQGRNAQGGLLPGGPGIGSESSSAAGAALLSSSQFQQPGTQNGPNTRGSQDQRLLTIEQLQADERRKLQDMIDEIRASNPYLIDPNGMLQLPGVPGIALAGLTEELATRRVAAEPALAKVRVRITRLPLDKSGKEALKPYGYELFENSLSSLLPMLDQPVPSDYIVGPGDLLQLQLYGGNNNQNLILKVGRDGVVNIPQLGPITVGGQRYSEAKSEVEGRVQREMIGVHAALSMGEMRTINVFVLGEAKYPGSYTVSGLATVTTALFAAGGVQKVGSLRSIQVKRGGELIRTFDLYDLLMRGDSSADVKLLPGDVVFIPPVGPTVSVYGEVQRPAIYELKSGQTVADLVQMGGGMTPDADRNVASLLRVDPAQHNVVLNVNPGGAPAMGVTLRNGDSLHVSRLLPQIDSGVVVQGYVHRAKYVAWKDGLRLSEVIPSVDELRKDADTHYLLIRRETPPDRTISVLSADLAAALGHPGSVQDIVLRARDQITVFDLHTSREHIIQPLMEELRIQSNLGQPTEIVHVDGRVKVAGDYPLEPGMRVSDLIRAGGSLDPAAYGSRAELSRYTVDTNGRRDTQVISVDLDGVRRGDPAADIPLQAFDRLSIKQVTGWTEQDQVQLKGEVRFPGTYSIQPGETLHSVINRAGGFTSFAFVQGSVFTRRELKQREQEQLDRLAARLRTEIAEVALMGVRGQQGGAASAVSIGETLLSELTQTKAVGRLVVDLRGLMNSAPGSKEDVILRDGDELIVPKQRQEVMVLGEVQDPTSHLYKRSMVRDDYIDQSGGPTRQADKRRIYVVRADGTVDSGSRGWFRGSGSVQIRPGDAIVVPLDTERLPSLTLYSAVSQIVYNIAIAAATAHAVIP